MVPEVPRSRISPTDMHEKDFYSWMNDVYLLEETQADIKQMFGEESEIQLTDFLSVSLNRAYYLSLECLHKDSDDGRTDWADRLSPT